MKGLKSIIIIGILVVLSSCNVKDKQELTITFTGDVILDRGVGDELRLYGDSCLSFSMLQLVFE